MSWKENMTSKTPNFFNTKIYLASSVFAVAGICTTMLASPTFAASSAIDSFKDANLKRCVLRTYNQSNNTNLNKLTAAQLKSIKTLSCPNLSIKNMSGLDRLTGLTSLSLENNKISSIDLSKNMKLTFLNLSNNKLRSLNLTKLTKLSQLYISSNRLSTLDVRKNKLLTTVMADNILFTTNATASQAGPIYVLDLTSVPFFHASTTLYAGGLYDYLESEHLLATKNRNELNNMMENDTGFNYVPGYTYRIKLPNASNVSMNTVAKKLATMYKNHATTYGQLVGYLAQYGITEPQTRSAANSLRLNYGRQAMLSDISKLLGYFMAKSHSA